MDNSVWALIVWFTISGHPMDRHPHSGWSTEDSCLIAGKYVKNEIDKHTSPKTTLDYECKNVDADYFMKL